jgi:hypothetical protein
LDPSAGQIKEQSFWAGSDSEVVPGRTIREFQQFGRERAWHFNDSTSSLAGDDELTFRSHCDLIGRELQKAQDSLLERAGIRLKGAASC